MALHQNRKYSPNIIKKKDQLLRNKLQYFVNFYVIHTFADVQIFMVYKNNCF